MVSFQLNISCTLLFSSFSPPLSQPEEKTPAIIPLGAGKKPQQWSWSETIKEKIVKWFCGSWNRLPADKLFYANQFGTSLNTLSLNADIIKCLEAVRLAPSARNKQPWRVVVREEQGKPRRFLFYRQSASQFYSLIDMGIGMYHWQAANEAVGRQGRWEECAKDAQPDTKAPKGAELIAVWVEA